MKEKILLLFALTLIACSASGIIAPSPTMATNSILDKLASMPGALETTPRMLVEPLWNTSGSLFADNAPLMKNQICFGLGNFAGTNLFEVKEMNQEQFLLYRGQSSLGLKFSIACDLDKTRLLQGLEEMGFEECIPDCDLCGSEKCCAILLKTDESKETLLNKPIYNKDFDMLIQTKTNQDNLKKLLDRSLIFLPLPALILAVLGAFFLIKKKYWAGGALIFAALFLIFIFIVLIVLQPIY